MSRSHYSDDLDQNLVNCWRANVDRAIGGKRGQAFLREMAVALDAMPVKELIVHELVASDGCCAIGAVAVARGQDVSQLDPSEPDDIAQAFGISRALACEIVYENDGQYGARRETAPERWTRMRRWVAEHLR
jgi:hypothetical protein